MDEISKPQTDSIQTYRNDYQDIAIPSTSVHCNDIIAIPEIIMDNDTLTNEKPNNPNSTTHDENDVRSTYSPSKGAKRRRQEINWKKNILKTSINTGSTYISKAGKIVDWCINYPIKVIKCEIFVLA
jgi:hypothetical protein